MSSEIPELHITEEPEITKATETPIEDNSTEPPAAKIPKIRSEAQKLALDRARVRAMTVRTETALKRKALEIEKVLTTKIESDRVTQIKAEYDAIHNEDYRPEKEKPDDEQKQKRRKSARRIIVTEVSSASEESDVEIVLPKARGRLKELPSQMELAYKKSAAKMFLYS
jgi:hypothetical protein